MGDDLVAEEIEVDPVRRASPFRAAEQAAVEGAGGVEIVDREGEVEGGQGHGAHLVIASGAKQSASGAFLNCFVASLLAMSGAVKPLALAFLAGLAAACGFQPLGLWPLTLAAFALLLWLIREAPGLRSALARGWWFGVGHFVLGLNWIATAFTYQAEMPASLGYVAVVLLSLYLAVYPAAAAGLAWRWGAARRRCASSSSSPPPGSSPNGCARPCSPASPGTRSEWLWWRRRWPTRRALVGTYGLSGARRAPGRRRCSSSGCGGGAGRGRGGGLAGAVAAAGLLAGGRGARPGRAVALRIVQPNIGQQDKWREGFEDENLARLAPPLRLRPATSRACCSGPRRR